MANCGGSEQPITNRFYKIILSHAHESKLELPRKFVVKHGRNLANNVAYLTVPGGSAWKVELLKETQRAWLNQGWEAFVKFYTIELGYFLMFELVGNSVFRVIIFDTRTVEIEYPPQLAAVNQQSSRPVFKSEPVRINESNVPSVNADVKVGNTEDMKSPDDKHCEVSGCYLLESSESLEPKGEEREVEAEEEVVVKEEVEVEAEEEEDDEDEGISSWSWRTLNDKRKPAKRQRRFYPYDKEMLMRNARASAGKIPSFIVKMRPSYVKYMYRLNVPRVFENKFLGKDKNTVKSVILQNEKRKTWLVKSMSGKFSTGWKEFVEGNQLKVDDVCVFELIKRPGFVFRVVISRASEDV
ncbi:hypothetical protein Droror1_Dr00021771 [Drosera rotundifolia]